MAKTSTYWDKRALNRLTGAEKTSKQYIKQVQKMYDKAYRNLNKEIETIYQSYSNDTGIDVTTLKQLLTKKETSKVFKELKAKGYDKYIKNNYKSRITRLEQLKAQVYMKAKDVYTEEELINHKCYSEIYSNSYYRTIYDTQMGTGLDFGFSTIDDNLIKSLLNERWSGKNYSQRIWGNTDILAESVSEIIGASLMSGQSLSKTTREIHERFGVAKHYAERLVRTETNHFNNEADAMAYEEMGVKEYVFVAVLDSRTSPMCQSHDNKVYKYKDRQAGVNYPPLHPNCRSTTRGYLGEEAEKHLQRRARDPKTGKNELIGNMSYKEWAKSKGLDVATRKRGGQLPAKPVVNASKSVKIEVKPLTDRDKQALEYYVSGEGMYVSNALRGVNKDIVLNDKDMEFIKDLDHATDRPLEKQTLYRSVDASVIFKDINEFEYEDLRGYLNYGAKGTYETNRYNNLMSKQVKEFKDLGYVSTTKDYEIARDWGGFTGSNKPIVLELNLDDTVKGVDLDFLDIADDPQKETLLARNQIFKVKEITAKDGNIYVKVDVTSGDVLNNKVKDTVEKAVKTADKMTLKDLPSQLTTPKEAKNSQLFIDAINNPKADPKVAGVYKNMGKYTRQDFKVSHAKDSSLKYVSYRNTDSVRDIKLTIPNIGDANNVGAINTTLHENMHFIDFMSGNGTTYTSTLRGDLVRAVNSDSSIGEEIQKLFDDFNELCDKNKKAIQSKYNPMYEELNRQIRAKEIDYKVYKAEWSKVNKLWREAYKEAGYNERNYMGGGINNLQDIYDALSGGKYVDMNKVRYGHGTKYYRTAYDKRIKEIVADYGALSITRPDLIELLRADKPMLVQELDALMDTLK